MRRLFRRYLRNIDYVYPKAKYIYIPLYWTANSIFYPGMPYSAYQTCFRWLRLKFISRKYQAAMLFISKTNYKLLKKKRRFFLTNSRKRHHDLQSYLYLYNYFFFSIYIDLFCYIKYIKYRHRRSHYYLILSFNKTRLFVNLQNRLKKNYLFLSSGLFIKFFEKRKSFKKNKSLKLLMAKYVRKLFLISKIRNTILIVKNNPLFLLEIINFFNTPIVHKFLDPVECRTIEESEGGFIWIKFLYFIFLSNLDFSKNKKRKRGRIKRKILRKLVFENKLVD